MHPALHRLMYGLLFPAVLGTLFVLFVSDDLAAWRFSPRLLFSAVFIFHWCFEFVLSGDKKHKASYSTLEFVGDLLVIVFMYKAVGSLPAQGEELKGYQGVYFWMLMLPLAFLAIDVLRWFVEDQSLRRPIVLVDIAVLLVLATFWFAGWLSSAFRYSDLAFYIFATIVFVMSGASFWARKDRLGLRAVGGA